MGLPAKRRTRTSKRERAAHFALRAAALTSCSHCKKMILPHRACPHCGWYGGRDALHFKTALDRRARKKAERLGKRKPGTEEKKDQEDKKG